MEGRKIRVAAIQMSSTPDKEENKEAAEVLVREAASAGADLVALPELWSCHGFDEVYRQNAEPVPGPTTNFLGDLARDRAARCHLRRRRRLSLAAPKQVPHHLAPLIR